MPASPAAGASRSRLFHTVMSPFVPRAVPFACGRGRVGCTSCPKSVGGARVASEGWPSQLLHLLPALFSLSPCYAIFLSVLWAYCLLVCLPYVQRCYLDIGRAPASGPLNYAISLGVLACHFHPLLCEVIGFSERRRAVVTQLVSVLLNMPSF